MIGDLDFEEAESAEPVTMQKSPKKSTSSDSTSHPSSSNSKQSSTSQLTALEVGLQNVTVTDWIYCLYDISFNSFFFCTAYSLGCTFMEETFVNVTICNQETFKVIQFDGSEV